MDLFEYQGKQYFARYDIPVSPGGVANTVDEAVAQADSAGYPVVVKAQVQVGGRGKAGGIKLANDAAEVRTARGEHPRHGHQGPRRQAASGSSTPATSPRSTTPVHARPGRQEAPADALGRGWRRDRVGRGRRTPTRSCMRHINPVDGLLLADAPPGVRRCQAQPGRGRWRRRDPRQALPTASPRATAIWPRSTR